ncbi:DUF3221 domain-containing protein [Pontibacter anaerobius]|uniref:DUF3221 domain-containing protein n=1 Tax=Pontibacter anaerobius TaxID=2993940 RepID=A0ABT3RDX1_9BACT|nr:DUF3221 domain-containing protein [Pontibacter anaerobius]MCX2740042.1 DUF3221 domain-containing protein [Pontibacter anaerobius]
MKQATYSLTSLLLLTVLLFSCRQEPKRMPDTLPDVYGYITDIKRTSQNGEVVKAVVAVKAIEGVSANYTDASVKIDKHTLIEDETGEHLKLDQLREGHQVQAWFDGDVLMKQPVQGHAKAMRISY